MFQRPAQRHHDNQRDERQIFPQGRGFFGRRLLAAQGIARAGDGRFDLRTDIFFSADEQLFGREQHLNVVNASHLFDGVFDFARAGGAVHPVDDPGVALAVFRQHGCRLGFASAVAAAVVFRRRGAEFQRRELWHFFRCFWSRHGTLR
ncbi:hypothetical protein D3C81_1503280 [compost metagenome]